MPHPPPDPRDFFSVTPHHEPMDFMIATLTPDENGSLRALCSLSGVRLRALGQSRYPGPVEEFAVYGPKGVRIVKIRDCQPWTFEVFKGLIVHGLEQIG